jgi:protein-tyrosine phosphatase
MYAIIFMMLGICLLLLAYTEPRNEWLIVWMSANCWWVSLAYLLNRPGLLGKKTTGRMSASASIFLLPYYLLSWILWRLQTGLTREPKISQVAPGLWIGGRVGLQQLPGGIVQVIDLAAEFPEIRHVVESTQYISIPVLDGISPPVDSLVNVAEQFAKSTSPIYVHCALGHGRSATMAAGILLLRGMAASVAEAELIICAARPKIRLNRNQKATLAIICTKRQNQK